MVPEDLISRFFKAATLALEQLEYSNSSEIEDESFSGPRLSLSACRRIVLEKQKYVLLQTVNEYNRQHGLSITVNHAQGYLAGLKRANDATALFDSMAAMEDSARLAVCRLVLYNEIHLEDKSHRELQTDGTLERSKIIDFIALCQTAIRLPFVQKHLADGSPLFEAFHSVSLNDQSSSVSLKEEPTAMQFPQARLERIQSYLSKAVGWDPEFTTRELRQLFLEPKNGTGYANDSEIMNLFQQAIMRMNDAVAAASLQASTSQLSDVDQGGVTRVISVQCSEVSPASAQNSGEMSALAAVAPSRVTIDHFLTDEEQKRQIRVASEATRLQKEIVAELLSMPEEQRNRQLDEAKLASEEFLKKTLALPPGRERVAYMQSIDPRTSRLLAVHKLWPTVSSPGSKH